MLTLSPSTRILLAVEPIDGRIGFNGLHILISQRLGEDPLTGQLFLFTNRRRNRLKALYWENGGYWLCTKRIESGTLAWPTATTVALPLRAEEFVGLAQGMKLIPRRGWYRGPPGKEGSATRPGAASPAAKKS